MTREFKKKKDFPLTKLVTASVFVLCIEHINMYVGIKEKKIVAHCYIRKLCLYYYNYYSLSLLLLYENDFKLTEYSKCKKNNFHIPLR